MSVPLPFEDQPSGRGFYRCWWRLDLDRRIFDHPHAADEAADETDDRIADRVAETLVLQAQMTVGRVYVQVQNRVVILSGHVGTPVAVAAASRTAWATPGVRDVSNQLSVRRPGRT